MVRSRVRADAYQPLVASSRSAAEDADSKAANCCILLWTASPEACLNAAVRTAYSET
jgi:hypothetical protein